MTSRALSGALKRQLFKPHREKDIRILLTADHSKFNQPFRFASGDPREFTNGALESNGNIFQIFPFTVRLLSDDDQEPQAIVQIQNVDDRIGATILGLPEESLSVTLQAVLREDPDTIEYEATNLELVDVEISSFVVTGRLVIRGLATEPCPGRVVTNRISPVFFR